MVGAAGEGEPFYAADLAHVHDSGFGAVARAGAATLRDRLTARGVTAGLVVELGCGSGISSTVLVDAGFEVLGFDLSADFIALARRREPRARFVRASYADAEIPPCAAVTALGECLNYAADQRAGRELTAGVFRRVHAALPTGGLFLLDVAEPGIEPAGTRRTWTQGPDWVVCVELTEDASQRRLERQITVFRRSGAGYRRSDERHTALLYPRQEVLADLTGAGFQAEVLTSYAGLALRPGHVGVLAVKS
jgi:SAM-dependent methyltransferase